MISMSNEITKFMKIIINIENNRNNLRYYDMT